MFHGSSLICCAPGALKLKQIDTIHICNPWHVLQPLYCKHELEVYSMLTGVHYKKQNSTNAICMFIQRIQTVSNKVKPHFFRRV